MTGKAALSDDVGSARRSKFAGRRPLQVVRDGLRGRNTYLCNEGQPYREGHDCREVPDVTEGGWVSAHCFAPPLSLLSPASAAELERQPFCLFRGGWTGGSFATTASENPVRMEGV